MEYNDQCKDRLFKSFIKVLHLFTPIFILDYIMYEYVDGYENSAKKQLNPIMITNSE